jgi:hypothetical protein
VTPNTETDPFVILGTPARKPTNRGLVAAGKRADERIRAIKARIAARRSGQ